MKAIDKLKSLYVSYHETRKRAIESGKFTEEDIEELEYDWFYDFSM